jgi:hypothetical protein
MTEHEALNNLVAALQELKANEYAYGYGCVWLAFQEAKKLLAANPGGKHGVQSGRLRLGKRRVGQKRPSNRKGNSSRVDNRAVFAQAYERNKRRKAAHKRPLTQFSTTGNGWELKETLKGLYYPRP